MTSNVFPMSYLEPCFLLSSHKFDFPPPVDASLILIFFSQCNRFLSSFSAPGSHQLVFIAYFIVYYVLSSCIRVELVYQCFLILKRMVSVSGTRECWSYILAPVSSFLEEVLYKCSI